MPGSAALDDLAVGVDRVELRAEWTEDDATLSSDDCTCQATVTNQPEVAIDEGILAAIATGRFAQTEIMEGFALLAWIEIGKVGPEVREHFLGFSLK
jgi:hypothetical protein